MKLLLLLTASFPCGSGEEFLSHEIPYIRGFDRVLICPCGLKGESAPTRSLPASAEYLPLRRIAAGNAEYGRLLLLPCVRQELSTLLRAGRFSPSRVHEMLFFMRHAVEIFRALKREAALLSADEITVYSYWFYDAAAAGAMLVDFLRSQGKKTKLFSRAHGFDVHEERAPYGYLPMRRFLLERVETVFPCSLEGENLLKKRYPRFEEKIRAAHLGTPDAGIRQGNRNGFHLVSCSYMVPVKRLHLIAEALKQADFPLRWTHIGSGPLEGEIRAMAERFPACVRAEFAGALSNADVLDFYRTKDVALFLNVSSSEGVPVSIMEACSFGIPVVATDVGGTGEIVRDGENGFLLKKNFSPEELLRAIRNVRTLSEAQYGRMCKNSRDVWLENFSAERNYPEFYEVLHR